MATVELTHENFSDTIDNNDIVLVDFWASWCGPCMRFGPIYEQTSEKFDDVVFGKLDTEDQRDVAAAFEITSIPTIMAFRAGYLVFRQAGLLNGSQLEDLVKQLKDIDVEKLKEEAEKN